MNRRDLLAGSAAALGGSAKAAPYVARTAERRWTTAIPVGDFVRSDRGPAGEALQAALDASFEAGLPLIFPPGDWIVDKPLAIKHTERRRRGFPRIIGAGVGSSRLVAVAFEGPLLSVQGVPLEPPAGSFFLYGGGIEGIEFVGTKARQTGIETCGWWYGTLKNCRFVDFGRHGVRVIGSNVDPNPDWSASILRAETCLFERIGEWGFIDDNPIGAPSWIFDRCLFNLCGSGGAFVRSSGNQFLACSFAEGGFVSENHRGAAAAGVGLRIGDASAGTINRTRVIIAEFDSNRDAHILIDRSTSCLIEDARFIHNDRNGFGSITPPIAVELGSDNDRSLVTNIDIVRPLVRIDQEGEVVGYRLATRNASQIHIDAESRMYNPARLGKFTQTEGFPAQAEAQHRQIEVRAPSD
jgi:hypothetical protein